MIRCLRLSRAPCRAAAQLKSYRFPEHLFQCVDVAVRRPHLELRVPLRAKPCRIFLAIWVEIDRRNRLRVASIEPFRQPYHRRQLFNRFSKLRREVFVTLVRLFRHRLPVIARDKRDDFGFVRFEAAQITILDEVIRMPVVAFVADMDADVVQQRAIFEPFTLALAETVR
jgi:hypothetical protein